MILIAHNIRSLHNVGSFFRTSDAFDIEKIYLTGYTGCPPRKEIAKTALGSEHRVVWEHKENIVALMQDLKQQGYYLVALEMSDQAKSFEEIDVPAEKIVLLLGSEVEGVEKELLHVCDAIVEIKTVGVKKSLNVSVALGIALFAMNQKKR